MEINESPEILGKNQQIGNLQIQIKNSIKEEFQLSIHWRIDMKDLSMYCVRR
jgi:hypothetical protein